MATHVELQAEMAGGGKGAKFTLKGLTPVLVLMYLEKGERSSWTYSVYATFLLQTLYSFLLVHATVTTLSPPASRGELKM